MGVVEQFNKQSTPIKIAIVGGTGLTLAVAATMLRKKGGQAEAEDAPPPDAAIVGNTSAGSASSSSVASLWDALGAMADQLGEIELTPGPAGPAGPAGVAGAAGSIGAIGPSGPSGATGAVGANGTTGPMGPSVTPDQPAPVAVKTWRAFSSILSLDAGNLTPDGLSGPVSVVNTGPTSDPTQFNADVYAGGVKYSGYIDSYGNVTYANPLGGTVTIGGDKRLVNQPSGYGRNY